jgi:hypothetical protein
MKKNNKVFIEFTDEEVHHILVMLRLMGFREKRDTPIRLRRARNEESRKIGKIMKKLRKADNYRESRTLSD